MRNTGTSVPKSPFVLGVPRVWFFHSVRMFALGMAAGAAFFLPILVLDRDAPLVYYAVSISTGAVLFALQIIAHVRFKRSYPVGRLYHKESKLPCPCCGFPHSMITEEDTLTCQECGVCFSRTEMFDAWRTAFPRHLSLKRYDDPSEQD